MGKKEKLAKDFVKDLINNPMVRECRIYCYKCAAKYPFDVEAYNYWGFIHSSDVRVEFSPITQTTLPKTHCLRCGNPDARIYEVKKKFESGPTVKEKQERIKEELKITDSEWQKKMERNQEDYAKTEGKEGLEKDFLQPFMPDGEPNLKYAQTYPEQIKDIYNQSDIGKMSAKDIGITKYLNDDKEEQK